MVRKIKKYEKLLSAWLKTFAEERTDSEMEYQSISDTQNHHYQVIRTGWYDDGFIYNVLFHFQIKENGKIWILANQTDIPLEPLFEKWHIPKSDIVPAFHTPEVRAFAGFAIA
jgi:hypothetical protein